MTREGKQKTLETHVAQHAHSLSQRSGPLWHSPVQKSSDSTTHRTRPGSKKADNRVRPRKSNSVILKPNACGGREPVLEAGEHRAVQHNTRRRSLNHYNGTGPAGRLESHNRFSFPALPSILFPSGFKERLVVLCSIFCPLLACALLCFPPAVPFSAHNRFFLPWAVYYRPLAFPPTFIVCCLRFLFAWHLLLVSFCFMRQQNRSKRRRGVCGDNNSFRRGNRSATMSLQNQRPPCVWDAAPLP